MTITVQLDPSVEELLERLARARGRTKEDIVREAIAQLAADEGIEADAVDPEEHPETTTLDRLRPFVGVVDSGGLNRSTDAGRKVREMWLAEHRARSLD